LCNYYSAIRSTYSVVTVVVVALITVRRRRDNTSTPPPNNNTTTTTTRYRIRTTTSTVKLRLFRYGLRVSTAFGVVSLFRLPFARSFRCLCKHHVDGEADERVRFVRPRRVHYTSVRVWFASRRKDNIATTVSFIRDEYDESIVELCTTPRWRCLPCVTTQSAL